MNIIRKGKIARSQQKRTKKNKDGKKPSQRKIKKLQPERSTLLDFAHNLPSQSFADKTVESTLQKNLEIIFFNLLEQYLKPSTSISFN